VVSGFKVFPEPDRGRGRAAPRRAEVAAVGVPDEKSGEVVKIIVVKKDPALSADLLAHCRLHLTGYKMPKVVEPSAPTPLPKQRTWARFCAGSCARPSRVHA
jgi:long-chain acyl-CoA synthetase